LQTKKTDIEVIKAILSGSKVAFRELYNRYARNHLLTCLRYVKNKIDAEDVLQEAYILIYRDLKKYDASKSKYITWSNRVVINTCLMHLRKHNIFKFSDDIPKGYRTVFNMFVIDGYSHAEIAEMLNFSVSTSKTQLLKARKMLQKNIGDLHFSKIQKHVRR